MSKIEKTESQKVPVVEEDWLKLFYSRIDNNLSITRQGLHATNQWVITLSLALITAIASIKQDGEPFPNQISLFVLIISFPFLIRFFIRSCIEYSIQEKFTLLRNEIDYFFIYYKSNQDNQTNKLRFLNCMQKYYYEWKSPKSMIRIISDNLRLTYSWIFIIHIGLLLWSAIVVERNLLISVTALICIPFLGWEVYRFITYRGFIFEEWPEINRINII